MFYYSKIEATMSKVRLIVVGNGMVGHRFIEELIERADPGRYEITVFGAEPRPAYDRVHLSSYFSHHTKGRSLPRQTGYDKHGIRLLLGEAVKKSTERPAKCTPTRALWSVTTSWCWPPAPTPGTAHPGQPAPRVLRLSHHRGSESHPQRRQERQERGGDRGGLLGLEAAGALKALGLETHVVEFAPVLMAEQLDGQGGQLLRRKIESMGVQVHTSKKAPADLMHGGRDEAPPRLRRRQPA